MQSPMPQNQMNNPQMFAQMLQQQGYSPQSNLVNNPTPQGGAAQPPQPAPASAPQMMQRPPAMQQPPLQQPGMAQPRPPVATPQNPAQGGNVDHQAQAAQLLNQIHQLEAQHGSPKAGTPEAAQLQQLKAVLLNGASGGKAAPKPQFNPQEAAALGRMGDTTVVHMTPGEMTVPKELQTPEMMKTMQQEYAKKGVSPAQFTVGSPHASVNPKTGLQEFSFWSSFLPVVGGVVGGIFGGPLGAAAGASLGGFISGKKLGASLEGGAIAGLGSYAGGQLFGNSGSLGDLFGSSGDSAATQAANSSNNLLNPTSAAANAENVGASSAVGSSTSLPASAGNISGAAQQAANPSLFSKMITPNTTLGAAGLTGAGAMLGNSMYQPQQSSSTANPALPSGYNNPMTPVNSLGNAQQQLGQTSNTSYQPANYSGYNPSTNFSSAYNFFPSSSQSTNAAQTQSNQPIYNNYPVS